MMERDLLNETRFVRDCLNSGLDLTQIWYTIDLVWWKQWKRYVSYDNSIETEMECESPGAIDNSCLIKNDCFNDNALIDLDFEIIPEPVWQMFSENYGLIQTDTSIFKRYVIKEGNSLRVELYPLKLTIFIYGDDEKENPLVNYFSCMTKLIDVEKFVQSALNIPDGAVYQLIQEYDNGSLHVIHYASETTTLSDAGFSRNQKLFVDVRNSEGEFSFRDNRANYSNSKGSVRGGSSSVAYIPPSSSSISNQSTFKNDSGNEPESYHYKPGICGLANLGNTCFMNSAIQCISNVPIITNYFLNNDWNADLNKDNPLGMGGRIATAYANLIREMWSGTTGYALPRDFKYEVAQFAPQFCGYSQHDSQELMMFLLDGLHEDLNRVTVKPYIEQKHSANQPDQLVADDNWQYHLKRNNSIIVDYFHGQLKSRVVCPDCNFVSVTFDPFASLSLPLRHSYYQSVIFYPLDPRAPIVNLSVSLYKNSLIETLKEIVMKEVELGVTNQLIITQVRKFKLLQLLNPGDSLSNIPSDDQIVMYEVAPLQPDHCYIDVTFKEKSMYSNLCLPIMIQMHRKINWHRFMIALRPHFPRFLSDTVSDSDLDSLFAAAGDSQSQSDDDSGPDSPAFANNPFENIFSVVLLDSQNSEHEINPLSRSRALKADHHLLIEWTYHGLKYSKDSDTTRISCGQQVPKPTVEDGLQQFLSEEFLGEKDLWFCPKCKKDKAASKKLDIWRLPKVLVLHLKRFKATSYFGDKINSEVLFPITNLDLSRYVPVASSDDDDYVYDLVAVSNHVGCLAGGHYFAYAKNCVDGSWYKFDDSLTSPVAESELVTKSAYVLVYVARSCARDRPRSQDDCPMQGHVTASSSDMEVDIDEPE